jgi:hypothetical protein
MFRLRDSKRSFGKGVLPFEKGVLPFEKGVLPFEKGVLLFEKGVLLFEKGVLVFEKGVLLFEKGVLLPEKGVLLDTWVDLTDTLNRSSFPLTSKIVWHWTEGAMHKTRQTHNKCANGSFQKISKLLQRKLPGL